MGYEVGYIEEAMVCAGLTQEQKSAMFAHLEARCECEREECPRCGEPEINGRIVHNVRCPIVTKGPTWRVTQYDSIGHVVSQLSGLSVEQAQEAWKSAHSSRQTFEEAGDRELRIIGNTGGTVVLAERET